MDSVLGQSLSDFEYLVVDGASTDDTAAVVARRADPRIRWSSAPDDGTYDAMAKGIAQARGRYVAILNSDDVFADPTVLEAVAAEFGGRDDVLVYGDIEYFDSAGAVVRRWVAGRYDPRKWRRGWHPPHPAVFVPRALYGRYGSYDPSYRLAADYKFLLRIGHRESIPLVYLPRTLARMQTQGQSTRGIRSVILGNRECLRAWRELGLKPPVHLVPMKLAYKLRAHLAGVRNR